MKLATTDLIVLITYVIGIVALGLFVSRRKNKAEQTSNDYFLAGNTLTWWAVGASLIASNISAEQFVAMSGAGYSVGIGVASYELMSAATLLIIAKFFLPVFIKRKIYTMPQFLEQRYDEKTRSLLAVFWMFVYVAVNLTSVLYLGALTLQQIVGWDISWGIAGLALFSVVYSLYGGLMAVAWTDVVQVIVLLIGGLFTTYMALDSVSDGQGVMEGAKILFDKVPERFDLVLERGQILVPTDDGGTKDAYMDLPGISVLIGGMWVVNLYYWGCNQYITQRALAAKSLQEAQKGVVFAGFLKILMPLLVVIPGVAAFVLTDGGLEKGDEAYPWLLSNLPTGIKGLAFAGLMAAIVSSLSSMLNSFSTIFTMDIYKPRFGKNTSDRQLVTIGRIAMIVALVVASLLAKPLFENLKQAFVFIQNITGYVSPGILTVFLFGFFWRKATANAAFVVSIAGVVLSVVITYFLPEVPFINRMGIVFVICILLMVAISLMEGGNQREPALDRSLFRTNRSFNVLAVITLVLLGVIYTIFW